MQLSRARLAITAVVAAVAMTVGAGCGNGTSNTPTTTANAGTTVAPTAAASGPADGVIPADQIRTPQDCPTSNTKAFAKTRFVANAGLALGAFHRYLYKPYNQGAFTKGTPGRTKALVKATAATAFIVWRLKHAKEDAEASPALCRAIVAPINQLINSIQGMSPLSGNFNGLSSDQNLFDQFQQAASAQGDQFVEKVPDNLSQTN